VRGTLNVLQGALRAGCSRVIHTSTSEVYGTPSTIPIRETHPLSAQSPYAASKVAADQFAQSFHLSFKLPVVTLRPFNTFGPRQSARAIVATILSQLIAGRRQVQLGRLDPRRDLTFVIDTVSGFIRAATAPGIDGDTIQLGTGRAVSIGELFQLCCKATGCSAEPVVDAARIRPDGSEVLVLQSDPALSATKLGWKPEHTLEDGLARTAAWMRENLQFYDVDRLHT
jgi:nucleoside-diphosphate-sugar epimerase